MRKAEAAELFGNQTRLGEALGLSRAAISAWPDELDLARADRVVGAAIRLGRIDPTHALVEQARAVAEAA